MGYNLGKNTLYVRAPRPIFRNRKKPFKAFFTLFLMISVSATLAWGVKSALAIETTKASALVPEEARAIQTLSFTQKTPPATEPDPCLPLLGSGTLSSRFASPGRISRSEAGKTAAPVALGLVLGVRIALGPKEFVSATQPAQQNPDVRTGNRNGADQALAIAAYRSCKNNLALNQAR
jgi:hypothetical protein